MKKMENMKKYLIYGILLLVTYTLLPMVVIDTGSAMFILLFVIPIICLIMGIVFGNKQGFDWIYLILVFILFLPSIFIYYHTTDVIIYPFIYLVISTVGMSAGSTFRKK